MTRNKKLFSRFGLKIAIYLILIKFDTQKKLNILMNVVPGIDGLDPKLQIRENLVLTLKFFPIFMKFRVHNKLNMVIMNIIFASV